MESLLSLKNLSVSFHSPRGTVRAVDSLDLEIKPGAITGIIGESGSGKSTVLMAIMGLLPRLASLDPETSIRLAGTELTKLSRSAYRELRGLKIGMIFQDPMTSLNPAYPVGEQIREALRFHSYIKGGAKAERQRVIELLTEVGISNPEQRCREYPHQFSGGMQQRALIAAALACNPRLLLADEPTTALDVTIQAQILDLLRRINQEHGTTIVLVSHDIGMAAEFCDRIAVMYAGRLVEMGPSDAVVGRPLHPYTQGLIASLPQLGGRRGRLEPIPGSPPDPSRLPPGCAFAERCPHVRELCHQPGIPLAQVGPERFARCILVEEVAAG